MKTMIPRGDTTRSKGIVKLVPYQGHIFPNPDKDKESVVQVYGSVTSASSIHGTCVIY